jgi:hypothetical protein
MLKDHTLLSKQMETTSKAVAQLTLNQTRQQQPGFSSEEEVHSYPPPPHQSGSYGGMNRRPSLPKMSFPLFTGENPRIWKDKSLDYFSIFNLPETLWVQYASVNFDGPAAKWLQVHKLTTGLGD